MQSLVALEVVTTPISSVTSDYKVVIVTISPFQWTWSFTHPLTGSMIRSFTEIMGTPFVYGALSLGADCLSAIYLLLLIYPIDIHKSMFIDITPNKQVIALEFTNDPVLFQVN